MSQALVKLRLLHELLSHDLNSQNVALGLNSLFNMPRGEDPEFFAPSFAVVYVYPGTDALDMEELVVDKVEKRFTALENVNNIKTNVDDGLAVVVI